jgi:hypothetical protein
MANNNTLITGIAPEHGSALVAVLLLPFAIWLSLKLVRLLAARRPGRASRFVNRYDAAPFATRVTAALLLTTATVHLALPFGHNDAPLLSLMFWAIGIAFFVLALRTFGDKPWRKHAAYLLTGSIVGYLVLAGSGWQEEPDQVGICTKLVELAALGLVVIPRLEPAGVTGRRLARPLASTAIVALTLVSGLVMWVGSFVAHSRLDAASDGHPHAPGTAAHSHDNLHGHAFAARAQAGVIMRPGNTDLPTLEQVEAADRLASETRAAAARYTDYNAALADGYVPDGPKLGLQRHLKNKPHQGDGLILDPSKPELLVYATDGEGFLLLGVAYQMEKAGEPGPEVGGSMTRWHTHNICFTVLPPGFSLVSPFGNCPLGSVAVTLPEMIHVWTVDNPPGGPFADRLDDKWVRQLLAANVN